MFHCDEIYGADAGVYVSSGISYERNRMDYDADAVVAAFKRRGQIDDKLCRNCDAECLALDRVRRKLRKNHSRKKSSANFLGMCGAKRKAKSKTTGSSGRKLSGAAGSASVELETMALKIGSAKLSGRG